MLFRSMHLPNMYVLWEPGMPVEACLNPNAMALVPMAGLAGISGMTAGTAIAISSALGAVVAQASLINGAQTLSLPQFSGYVFAGPVVGTAVDGLDGKKISVSGLKVQAFDASGNLLATTDVHGDGSYELQLPNTYRGALLLKVFDPDDGDIEQPPQPVQPKRKRKRKVKRGGSGRVAKFLGTPIPKSPQRTRVINLVSKWVNDYGIKSKSKYILKMDIILGDALRSDDWNKEGLRSQDIANNIIQEFQDRSP